MQAYVLGFLFDAIGQTVLLTKKQAPDWMRNRFNGVGGKVEGDETPLKAMVREFREETGQTVTAWQYYASLSGEGWTVDVFAGFDDEKLLKAAREAVFSKESLHTFSVRELPPSLLPNAGWLIPMALSMTRGETAAGFAISEIRRVQ